MSIRAGAAIVIALALASPVGSGAAAPPSTGQPLDLPLEGLSTLPSWLSIGDGAAMAREFPLLPRMLGIGGRAVIQCETNPAGGLDACRVVNEAPHGFGFGAAAIRLAPYLHMKPAMLDDAPMHGSVTIPIIFKLKSGAWPSFHGSGRHPVAAAAAASPQEQ